MGLQRKDDDRETSPKKEEKDSNFHMKWFYGTHVTGWSAAVLNQIHLRSQQH